MNKITIDSRIFLPLLLSIIIVVAIFLLVSLYSYEKSNREDLTRGLTDFYRYDYYDILQEMENYYCDIRMRVLTENNSVLVNSNCTAEYPYSAFEAFDAVVRGELSGGGITMNTNLDWDMNEEEAFGSSLDLMQYPVVATTPDEALIPDTTYQCYVPCIDGNAPSATDIISVDYEPSREQLSRLFLDYELDNFKGLTIHSNYEYMTLYNSMEHALRWRYLVGHVKWGRFRLEIEVDKPVLRIENERENVQTETPEQEYEINEISENKFVVSGSGTGVDLMVVEW